MNHIDKTNELFKQVADAQGEKGIATYGKPLDPLDDFEWLNMALEESVDATQYIVAEMEKKKFVLNKIRVLADMMGQKAWGNEDSASEILFWCDELEGKNKTVVDKDL